MGYARAEPWSLADDLNDCGPHGIEIDLEAFEDTGGDTLAPVDEPEEDVLGADVIVVEEACFPLCANHRSPGPVTEPLEHRCLLLPGCSKPIGWRQRPRCSP